MNRDLTVFICGTFADLQEERNAVMEATRSLRFQHQTMEYFGAHDERPLDVCLNEVRQSDLLVVIVGHRYGSVAPDLGISFSEAEYRLALELGKPCYVFMLSDDVPLRPRNMEQDPEKLRLLQAWKRTLGERHTVAIFKSPTELAVRVVAALNRVLEAQQASVTPAEPSNLALTEIYEGIDDLIAAALTAGYSSGVIIGALRAALAPFQPANEPLGVRVLLLSGGPHPIVRRLIASALEKEGCDVWLEPLTQRNIKPGDLTAALESVEVVIVLSSGGAPPESWLVREVEAAMWRFLFLPGSVEILPVAIDGAAVPPLLRAKPHVAISSTEPATGVTEVSDAVRRYRSSRDSRGVRVARAEGLLTRPA